MIQDMLAIHSVNPTGMFSYGMSDDISLLNKGKVYLKGINVDKDGDSNGSGKSSLFNSICELLFKENPTGCKNDDVINSVWGKGMAGRLTFTNPQGDIFRVTYCRSWKDPVYEADNDNKIAYLGTALFLDQFVEGVWLDRRGKGMPETSQRIKDAVGMTYERFVAISYMSNRVGDQFLRGTNKDRMNLLSGIIGIGEWDFVSDNCRLKKKALNSQIQGVESKIHYEKGSLQTLQEQYQSAISFDWDAYIADREEKLDEARRGWKLKSKEISEQEDNIIMLREQQSNSYNKESVATLDQRVSSVRSELSIKERKLSQPLRVADDPKLSQALRIVNSQIGEINGSLRAFLGANSTLLDMDDCPTCGSEISELRKSGLQGKVDDLNNQLRDLKEEQADLNKQLIDKRAEAEEASKAQKRVISQEVNELRVSLTSLNEAIQEEKSKSFKYDSEIAGVKQKIAEIKALQQRYAAEGEQHKNAIDQAKTSIENTKALGSQIEGKKEHVEFLQGEIDQISEDLSVYLWLIDNIPYIKLHKMSVAMAEISDLCNKYFEEIGDSMRVSISSFEEKTRKKNAADVKDLMKSDVKLEITDGSKNINPKLYSDGEAGKVSIAIIRSLNEMARKSGQGCNLMVMDEVFSHVDTNNSQKIADNMSKMLKRGTIFLTDNSGFVENLIKFDQIWVAKKTNGQTVIEIEE